MSSFSGCAVFRRINYRIFKNFYKKYTTSISFKYILTLVLVHYLILIMLFDVCMYVNLYLNMGNHQLSLSLKIKLITTALHDCHAGIQYISYLLDISLKMLNGCSISEQNKKLFVMCLNITCKQRLFDLREVFLICRDSAR